MIGCDIHVFTGRRPVERQQKYLAKITTVEEQKSFAVFKNDEIKIGFLWSVKEASFKYCARSIRMPFHPKKYKVRLVGPETMKPEKEPCCEFIEKGFAHMPHTTCRVESPLGQLFSKTLLTDHFVYTIVANKVDSFDEVHWGIQKIDSHLYKDQTVEVRNFALNQFLQVYKLDKRNTLEFRSTQNAAPYLLLGKERLEHPFSFSHHQHYVSYCWC